MKLQQILFIIPLNITDLYPQKTFELVSFSPFSIFQCFYLFVAYLIVIKTVSQGTEIELSSLT